MITILISIKNICLLYNVCSNCYFYYSIRRACDCSFVYWHRVVFPIYMTDMFDNLTDPHRMHVSMDML